MSAVSACVCVGVCMIACGVSDWVARVPLPAVFSPYRLVRVDGRISVDGQAGVAISFNAYSGGGGSGGSLAIAASVFVGASTGVLR